jgi:beta-barrel assembly-enhancing protease
MNPGFLARFTDGETARIQNVRVRAEEDGLHLALETGVDVWAWATLFRHPDPSGDLRISQTESSKEQLTISDGSALKPFAPHLFDGSQKRRKGLRLALSVGAITLFTGWLVFFGLPALARPAANVTPVAVEEKIGESFSDQVDNFFTMCRGDATDAASAAATPLAEKLGEAAGSAFPIQVSFVEEPTPNAFALPGGRIAFTSGLLEILETPDEFAAVMAHEIGHVKSRDGLEKLYRAAGAGLLLDAVIGGGTGAAQVLVTLGGAAVDAVYTRGQEERADDIGLATMDKAGFDPSALAGSFRKLKAFIEKERAEAEREGLEIPDWFDTHPNLDDRIAKASKWARPGRPPALSAEQWQAVKSACVQEDEETEAPSEPTPE